MRINNTMYSIMPYQKAQAQKQFHSFKNSVPQVADAEISPIGKDLALVRKILKEIPDVREEKVNEIKEQIKNGTYNVTAEDLANKMLGL